MKKIHFILIGIVVMVLLLSTITINSPVIVVAEDAEEDASIDMAASFSITGFEWIYPGNSINSQGQTLHNVHINNPEDPYGAVKEIMEYSYNKSPHLIVSINNHAAQAIFGFGIVDNIRSNDAYNGYASNENVAGTMSRGDSMSVAMLQNGINVPMIPIQILLGNIKFIPV